MILQVPICFGYAPEERFTFELDQGPKMQNFFYQQCDISGKIPEGPVEKNSLEKFSYFKNYIYFSNSDKMNWKY